MTKKKIKKLPNFKSIEEESDFWDKQDTQDYPVEDVTEEFFKEIKINAKAKSKVTLRLDDDLLKKLKYVAAKNGIPYQRFTRELLKMSLSKLNI